MENALPPQQRRSLSNHRQASSKRAADFTSFPKNEASQERDENEENTKNGSTNRSSSKRMKERKLGSTSPLKAIAISREDSFASATRHSNDSDSSCDSASINSNIENEKGTGTGTGGVTNGMHDRDANASPSCQGGSVQKLKGWLSDFEQQQKAHFEKNVDHSHQTKVLAPSNSASVRPASRPVPRPSSTALPETTSHAATPSRTKSFAPKVKPEEVQATNDTHASVGKLSSWLADDPFQKQKEPGGVRRGAKVASKARAFEPLPQNDAVRTVAASRAVNVSDRKQWLQDAFKNNGECEETFSVSGRAKWLQTAFKPKKDSAHVYAGMDSSNAHGNDDSASGDHTNTSTVYDGSSAYAESKQGDATDTRTYRTGTDERVPPATIGNGSLKDYRQLQSAMPRIISNASTDHASGSSFTTGKMVLQSRIEGNVMQAAETFGGVVKLTSVQRRKDALERKEQDMKKKADPRGSLLKTKWEADEASHTFKKKMVDAHTNAPRKKLSDLP